MLRVTDRQFFPRTITKKCEKNKESVVRGEMTAFSVADIRPSLQRIGFNACVGLDRMVSFAIIIKDARDACI